jgi:2-methylcitrate dehydratase PrpD
MGILTESVVDFLQGTALRHAPEKSLALAAKGFTDCVAVMLAGHDEPVTQNIFRHIETIGGKSISRCLLGEKRATVAQSTVLGVAAAHALDFDDYAYSNHVSALLVPAILAEAERTPSSGPDLLRAYLAGFEVWAAVMKREPDHLHSKGWHPTGVFGAIGVAAALSWLRGLNARQTRNAIGLAAANGGGIMDNFGTQAKSYQGARAAEAGVACVELALEGVDAGPDAVDGTGGLLAALSPFGNCDLESPADWLGHHWVSSDDSLNIKLHPTVGASQRSIDAAIQLHRDTAPCIEGIHEIIVRVSEKHAAVMRFHRPETALEAKFSVEFAVAAGLIAGKVGLAELRDDFVRRDDVQQLIRKVRLEIGPDNDPDYPVGAIADTVAYQSSEGNWVESEPVHRFRGHGQNPMSNSEFLQKFLDCVAPGYGENTARSLFDTMQGVADFQSVDDIPVLTPLGSFPR